MKKGFTLIELLAVIIILAVIALIATPIVLDVIEDAKKSGAKSSASGVVESAGYYYAEEFMKNSGSFTEYECIFSNNSGCENIKMSGDRPTTGSLSINKDGIVNGIIKVNNYTFYVCNSKVLEEETSECSITDYTKIYSINSEGIITGFKTDEITFLNKIIPTVKAASITSEATNYIEDKKITIPEYVGDIEVKGIGDNTFYNYDIEVVTILSNKVITLGTNAL